MAPPVPDFLQLNGTPDPRAPRPPQPESQLPPITHIPGTFGSPENTPTENKVNTGDLGSPAPGLTNAPTATGSHGIPTPFNPGNPVVPSRKYRNHNKAPGPRPEGFINYPGAENGGNKIADAIAILAEANIQTVMPGGLIPTPNQEQDISFQEQDEETRTFLRVLEKSGRVTKAAEIAGRTRGAFRAKKRRDPIFSDLWDKALKHRAELFEDEAIRRAVNGVRKDIYYKGEVCGSEKVYSDALLSKLLEGNMPQKYRQNHKIELDAKMAVATLVLPATTSAEEWAAQNSGNIIEQAPEDEYAKDFD